MKKPKKPPKKTAAPKRKARTTRREDVGKLLLDVGKLVFAGVFIGGLLRADFQNDILILVGIVMAIVLWILGILLIPKAKSVDSDHPSEKKE